MWGKVRVPRFARPTLWVLLYLFLQNSKAFQRPKSARRKAPRKEKWAFRALRAPWGRFRKTNPNIFWREDFLEGRSSEFMCVCPAHPCARTFARSEAPLDAS